MITRFIALFCRRHLLVCLLACVCWMSASGALAVVDIYEFDTESQRERYFQLSEELRCPKCQNQNLAGSDSQIAGDLRRELRRLLEEGKTDKEIKGFMVDRYGEFVLYKPRLQKSTIVLWGLPILLLFLGAGVVWLITKRKKGVSQSGKNSDDDGVGNTLNSEERQTLERLLNKESPRHPSKKTTHQTIQHEESQ